MRHLMLWAGLCAGSAAFAQEADGGSPDAGGVAEQGDLANEIDQAAGAAFKPSAAAPAPSNPVARAFQSLNPDIAVIVDGTAGIAGAASYSLAGDDPDLTGALNDRPAGFTVQEAEVAFQAVVDPYFRADIFLTIPNLGGVEVEEAMVTTTSLPADLQVKAGIFRSAFGRQNGQHLHIQDFTRRPLINEAYLGPDGLRSPGVQISWLLPTPLFLQWSVEALSSKPPAALDHLATFGGGKRTELTYTTELKVFVPATEEVSVYGGLNAAFGKTAGILSGGITRHAGATTLMQAADLYLKYKPANVAGSYFSLAWTTEVFFRSVLAANGSETTAQDAGFYSQVVAQLARNWLLGVRQDVLSSSEVQPLVSRTAVSLTYVFSEFARLRTYVERETQPQPSQFFLLGPPNWAGYLQLEVAIGAHGAHAF